MRGRTRKVEAARRRGQHVPHAPHIQSHGERGRRPTRQGSRHAAQQRRRTRGGRREARFHQTKLQGKLPEYLVRTVARIERRAGYRHLRGAQGGATARAIRYLEKNAHVTLIRYLQIPKNAHSVKE